MSTYPSGSTTRIFLTWAGAPVLDLTGFDAGGEKLVAERREIVRVEVEQDALPIAVDRVARALEHHFPPVALQRGP